MITDKEQMLIWHTGTLEAFNHLNFDKVLYPNNVQGTETYLLVGDDKPRRHLPGYVAQKKHKDDSVATVYFIRTEDIQKLPFLIKDTQKIHSKSSIFNLVTDAHSFKIQAEKIFDWRQIIDSSGIPIHTNMQHWTLYKNKVAYSRTKGELYHRTITESAFGKDKFHEGIRLLLDYMQNISDPTVAKLFYAISHNRDVRINELPDNSEKKDFIKFCNALMKIGDKSKIIDNRARATAGTVETVHTKGVLSVSFTHNIPSYYTGVGKETFEQIFPYNVVNRYYYNLYEGFLQARFPEVMNYQQIAQTYQGYIRSWIKSMKWYEEHWHELENRYPNIPLIDFTFSYKEDRFRDHFVDFAKCLSHYANDEKEYLELLKEEYKTHKSYGSSISDSVVVTEERL